MQGNLSGQRQGQPVFITRLEVCSQMPHGSHGLLFNFTLVFRILLFPPSNKVYSLVGCSYAFMCFYLKLFWENYRYTPCGLTFCAYGLFCDTHTSVVSFIAHNH